jgi:fimbrial chaperone protein
MRKFRGLSTVALAAVLAFSAAPALAVSVQPLVIDLQTSGRKTSELVRVENTYPTPMPIEIRVMEAEYVDGAVRTTDRSSDDLLVFPPQAMVPAGQTQSFRVQYVGDPALMRSKHYVITVAQLPVPLPEGESAVQILYNFNVFVGVTAPGARSQLHVASAEVSTEGDGKPRPVLNVQNDGANYGYLAEGSLRLVERDPSGKEVFRRDMTDNQIDQEIGLGLVAPGQSRRIPLPIELPQPGGTIEAQFTPARR